MPRATRSNGRPGTEVFPTDWAASHRPTAERTQRGATVALRHPGTEQAWSNVQEQNIEVPKAPYYTGAARVQALATQARPVVTVGDREVVAQYLITVPATVAPAELDLVDVTTTDDPALEGRVLLVAQVVRGSLLFERDLFCTLDT